MNAKSDYAKFLKAIKKRFIKKLGRKEGGNLFRAWEPHCYGWCISFMDGDTVRSTACFWIQVTKEHRAANTQAFKSILQELEELDNRHSMLLINSPGGEIDPAEGIVRGMWDQIFNAVEPI